MVFYDEKVFDSIVKGVVAGYKEYIDVRKAAHENMVISDAYAFVKSNHIENQVYKHIEQYVHFTKQNAGPAWKFLKFDIDKEKFSSDMTFILKNESYFDENRVTFGKNALSEKDTKEKQYLRELIESNSAYDFEKVKNYCNGAFQMSAESIFFEQKQDEKMADTDKGMFMIFTYGIDQITRQLSSLKVWIPNPNDNTAYLYKELTNDLHKLIKEEEDYTIDEKDLEILQSDREIEIVDAEHVFGFRKEQEESDNN
ncbi:hypothetical protein [Mammaliicoccus sp. Dog046]|uniref:spr1630 family ClpXP-sensitive toxin n=1 Tax=Mammaliicoccus sp. Dog046 TaxID=3034233 RepID=UPI002B25C656|nr:hypothetical protein [Mammaliicoccus sp. Dog046]WQK85655.1 hypothetical protein P3U32_01085 [Mammaliicoccus sp. Dog046]